jgi:photosystem II stability/assembly factor-like uncharacterized protein
VPPQFVWRTRRRWLRWAVPTTVAVSVLAVCLAGSQAQSPLAGSVPAVLASSVKAGPRLRAERPDPLQAREIDAVGDGELIVANFQGVYKTTDMGRHWTDITPPSVPSPVILTHIFHVVSYGNKRIWLDLAGDGRFVFVPTPGTAAGRGRPARCPAVR